jgi:hypothetical protein
MDDAPEFKSGNASFRKALKAVVAYARKHGVNAAGRHGWAETERGWVPPVSSAELAQTKLGFTVTRASETHVKVSPSIVSGASVIAKMPVIGSTALDASEPPTLAVSAAETAYICLKVTIEPDSELGSDGTTYQLKAGAGLVVGNITVEKFASVAEMEDESQAASIDPADGATINQGIFMIPLAKQESGGAVSNRGYYFGPLGIRLCESGTIQIIGPVIVTADL